MFKMIFPNLKIERWKWNKEYRVYVSTFGHFKDEYKRPLPIKVNSSGYCLINTYYGHQLAHRIVMKTWCPTGNMDNLTVDHLDHNKRNNAITNLEWVTLKENLQRAKRDMVTDNMAEEPKIENSKPVFCASLNLQFKDLDDACVFLRKYYHLAINKEKFDSNIVETGTFVNYKWHYGASDSAVQMDPYNIKNPFLNRRIKIDNSITVDTLQDACNFLSAKYPVAKIDKERFIKNIITNKPYFGLNFKLVK